MKKILVLLVLVTNCCMMDAQNIKRPDSYNYLRGLEARQNGDDDEALVYLNKELEEHPKNGYAFAWISVIRAEKEEYGKALTAADLAVKHIPKKDKEYLSYAYSLRGFVYLNLEDTIKAINDYEMAIKISPEETDSYEKMAQIYYEQGKYDLSDEAYEKICKLTPGETLGYMGKGRNALEQKKYAEAADLFTYSIKLDDAFSQAYAFRAECNLALSRTGEAIDDVIKALSIDGNNKAYNIMVEMKEPEASTMISKLKIQQLKSPNDYKWPLYIGFVYQVQERYAEAVEYYKAANKIEETDVTYDILSSCYHELGDYELALENINQAIELDSSDDDFLMSKADLLYQMGRGGEAIELYDEYIQKNPENYGGYYRRGFMKDNLKDANGAIEDYSTAILLNPGYAYAYLGRADKYKLIGKEDAAIKDYKTVIELDTIYGENNCVQFAYLGIGDTEKAKQVQDEILAHSASAGNYYDAACLYARMGEKTTSLGYLEKSLEKGFHRFAHIRNDDDLDAIRDMKEYEELINKYERIYQEEQRKKGEKEHQAEKKREGMCEIPFTMENGNCYIKCEINGLPLRFALDTGASDVSISMVEATFMMKNGYLSKSDIVGTARYSNAEGYVSEGMVINLKKVKFGEMELENVRASVVKNQIAPLLLGQTVLSRIGKFEIDNHRKVLIINYHK